MATRAPDVYEAVGYEHLTRLLSTFDHAEVQNVREKDPVGWRTQGSS